MKRARTVTAAVALGAAWLTAATPAYAQVDVDTAGAVILLTVSMCTGVAAVLWTVFYLWMLTNAFRRRAWEYPGSKGGSRRGWLTALLLGAFVFGLPAGAYYFRIYSRGVKAGSTNGPAEMPPPEQTGEPDAGDPGSAVTDGPSGPDADDLTPAG